MVLTKYFDNILWSPATEPQVLKLSHREVIWLRITIFKLSVCIPVNIVLGVLCALIEHLA